MSLPTLDEVYAAWQADARARGLTPSVFPHSDPRSGQLAERWIDENGGVQYDPAPAAVEAVHQAVLLQERSDIDAGAKLQAMQDALFGASRWVLSLPRDVVAGIVGVPGWVVTGGVLLLAAWWVWRLGTKR